MIQRRGPYGARDRTSHTSNAEADGQGGITDRDPIWQVTLSRPCDANTQGPIAPPKSKAVEGYELTSRKPWSGQR